MKIRVILPAVAKEAESPTLEWYARAARPDTEVSVVSLDKGPTFVGSLHDAALAAPDTVAKIQQAEREGVHAAISDCMTDPGVEAAREVVSIPVIGPAQTSIHFAAMLGHKFSVVTPLDTLIPAFHHHAVKTGLSRQLVSVRGIHLPASELKDDESVLRALIDQSIKAVMDDGTHVIIFGSTGKARLAKPMAQGLRKEGIDDVPVIDPTGLALKIAEALADMGLSHSKRTYPTPPEKQVIGF